MKPTFKVGKGEPQWEQFVQGSSPQEPTAKTDKKRKIVNSK